MADRGDLGVMAQAGELGGVVDDVRHAARCRAGVGGRAEPADRGGLIAECTGGAGDVRRGERCAEWRSKLAAE